MGDEEGAGVEWNVAQLTNMELANRAVQASDAFINRDFQKAIDVQIARRMTAGFTFNKEERKKLADMEEKFGTLINIIRGRGSLNSLERQNAVMAEREFRKLYIAYVEFLNDTLDKYKWFGSRKKDSSRMNI